MEFFSCVTSININDETEISAQDMIGGIKTLSFKNKLSLSLPFPGKGPDFFLNWASEELKEAAQSADDLMKSRKYYNAAVYSKGSIECLVDWYLQRMMLNFSIPAYAGMAQKLEALDSDNLLGISFSLFSDIVFEPRNRGIHQYELVDQKEAKNGFELANLTIKNCVYKVPPQIAPFFYGNLKFCRGTEAIEKTNFGTNPNETFYFENIGDPGEFAVLLDRNAENGKISLLEVMPDHTIESRCTSAKKFNTSQLREIFTLLESGKPTEISGLSGRELQIITETLLEKPIRRAKNAK